MRANRSVVLNLLKTARGQINGIIRMIEEDRYCIDISNQLVAVEALLRKANATVLKAHVRGCVTDALELGTEDERTQKLDELDSIIDKLSK